MRLADRLFAFRRPPAWTDTVQVLLWLLGWVVLVGLTVFLLAAYVPMARTMVRFGTGFGTTMWIAMAFSFVVVAGWGLVAGWFVSEAYGGWRRGHRHGKQWALVIAVLLLSSGVWGLVMRLTFDRMPDMGAGNAALLAFQTAFGLALLVAALTTKPPAPAATAPPSAVPPTDP